MSNAGNIERGNKVTLKGDRTIWTVVHVNGLFVKVWADIAFAKGMSAEFLRSDLTPVR
jgi:hypothetical protein